MKGRFSNSKANRVVGQLHNSVAEYTIIMRTKKKYKNQRTVNALSRIIIYNKTRKDIKINTSLNNNK